MALVSCGTQPNLDPEVISKANVGERLPKSFLLGFATCGFSNEGNSVDSDWYAWEQGKFPDGGPHNMNDQRSGRAADSWSQWDRDHRILGYLGANAYRISIEWSRIEPREGVYDQSAIEHYRTILKDLRAKNIEPFVTVVHFVWPKWVADRGGWEWADIVPTLGKYAEKLAKEYGELVDYWNTVNEPNAIFSASYGLGMWPPGVADWSRAVKVYATTLDAHGAIAKALRATDRTLAGAAPKAAFIGLPHNMLNYTPASTSPLDTLVALYADDIGSEAVIRAVTTGLIDIDMPTGGHIRRKNPDLVNSIDYVALHYYRRVEMRFDTTLGFNVRGYAGSYLQQSDNGWAVDMAGFYRTLVRLKSLKLPIIITETGMASDDDALRSRFVRETMYVVEEAIAAGIDVRGVLVWTLLDNFEWVSGWVYRFGLFSLDENSPNLDIAPRGSAETFRNVARAMGRPVNPSYK